MRNVEIYLNDRFYGTIRMRFTPPPFTTTYEQIYDEIVTRLPLLKGKQFQIAIT